MAIVSRATQFRPASKLTRTVYAVALVFVALPPVLGVQYAWALLKQMPSNSNFVNPITAVINILVAVAVLFAVVYRLRGLLAGKFRLDLLATGGVPNAVRVFGLFLMYAGVLIFVLSIAARAVTGIVTVAIIAGQFYPAIAVGLIFFEFSRVLERELLLERRDT